MLGPFSPRRPRPPPRPAPKPFVVDGTVVGMNGLDLTVKDATGKPVTVTLGADTLLIQVSKISLDEIKPGSFVATANSADGGVSSELRVFAPPLNGLGEGSYPMQDGQNMTNGTVKTVVTSVKGREMDVGYNPTCKTNVDAAQCKAGVRHITVPESMVIHEWNKVAAADLKPGAGVSVRGRVVGDARRPPFAPSWSVKTACRRRCNQLTPGFPEQLGRLQRFSLAAGLPRGWPWRRKWASDLESLIIFLIVGAVAGWLAGLIVKGYGFGILGNMVIGILGAFIGGWLFGHFGIFPAGGIVGELIGATVGAVILLLLLRLIRRAA